MCHFDRIGGIADLKRFLVRELAGALEMFIVINGGNAGTSTANNACELIEMNLLSSSSGFCQVKNPRQWTRRYVDVP
jgi:hypothetical protein